MHGKRLGRVVVDMLYFAVFAGMYYTPMFIGAAAFPVVDDTRAQTLLASAVTHPAIQFEVARNLIGHLIPLLLCHVLMLWIAVGVARTVGLSLAVSRTIFLVACWILLVAGNQLLFANSNYSIPFSELARPEIAVAAALILLVGFSLALLRSLHRRKLMIGAAGAAVLAGALGAGTWQSNLHVSRTGARNVIIIGIDSLSMHQMQRAGEMLPNLASLVGSSVAFEHAYTPLARTFPAWMSLLSGSPPADHGAVFNLRGFEHIDRSSLVSHTLRKAGYRTVFAMDERRFSNIDESFGFDDVVGPKAGALDFVIQKFNDTPLTNIFLQHRLSNGLLPYSRLNVASHVNYDAAGFVDGVVEALGNAPRVFLAVHFESAHFPFKTRHASRSIKDPNPFLARQLTALTAVDAQVGHLLSSLREEGYLDDALLVVLSDHGEGLGEAEATMSSLDGNTSELTSFGHGGSILSEHQNRILMAVVNFRNGHATGPVGRRQELFSLTDVRPAIERFVESGVVAFDRSSSCMTVETGLRFAGASDYRTLNERSLVAEAAGYYALDSYGRMHLREDRIFELVSAKDVGLRCDDRLTYYSSATDRYFSYLIQDDGRHFIETEPTTEDIAGIDAYRARLKNAVRG